MTADPELLFRPALELADLVRAGELSARELAEASLETIARRNGEINAFCHVDAQGALATAEAIGPGDPRPFAGVPIAIKDNQPVAGMPLTLMGRRLSCACRRFPAGRVAQLSSA